MAIKLLVVAFVASLIVRMGWKYGLAASLAVIVLKVAIDIAMLRNWRVHGPPIRSIRPSRGERALLVALICMMLAWTV